MQWLKGLISSLFNNTPQETITWQDEWSHFYQQSVAFYRVLSKEDKKVFEQRSRLFLETTEITGQIEVSDEDCLLVAASAVIPVWGFPEWHYFNLKKVYLLAEAFNGDFKCGLPDSTITGMVGSGAMEGKMALSQPDLHLGFSNTKDKHNVGIHEFVHLIDMADGSCDGFPERLKDFSFSIPWFDLVEKKTQEICNRDSNIRDYGASNKVEFLAVASEYFFERPSMMKNKHPELYKSLNIFYQQDVMAITQDIKLRKKALCSCGSGKRYKRCCMPKA
ncbi:MAG: Mlc titration factor MtfA (ptsG expression regulator) [Pseudohongiellaceae bacterium]|jgi:Mlc titration factor MtfA (ptsG expression regulator)